MDRLALLRPDRKVWLARNAPAGILVSGAATSDVLAWVDETGE